MNIRITFTLLLTAFLSLSMSAQVIWGGPGDPNGEFNGGLNDWTTVGVSSAIPDSAMNAVWVWDADGIAEKGLFAGGNSAILSPTAGNGAALFNSDFLDNGGDDFGAGAAPSAPGNHSGELISPIFDCSGRENVSLTFYQDFRNFSATSLVGVSNDGGSTFTTYEINQNKLSNIGIPFTNTFYRVNISDVAANQDSVVVKFIFDGDYYYWTIDDVAVIETPALDIGLDEMYYAPTYANTPLSQLDAIDYEFGVDVYNLGSENQYDVKVAVSITDQELNTMFSDTAYIDTLLIRDTFFIDFDTLVNAEMESFAALGEYNLIYELFPADNDLEIRDDLVFERFSVTESLYSFDRGNIDYFNIGNRWVGNLYTTGSWEDSGNGNFVATKLFPAENTGSGELNGTIFKVNDDVDAQFNNFDFQADITNPGGHPDLTLVGFFIHNVTSTGLQSVDLIDIDTDDAGLQLQPNSRYLIMFIPDDGMQIGFDRRINFFQNSTFVYVPDDQLYDGGFGAEFSLVAGIELAFSSSAEEVLLPETTLRVYPNPANDFYSISLDFPEPSDVTVLLTGIDGKIFKMENLSNITQLTKRYETSSLVNGTYLLRILTEDGVRTEKLVVQK